MPSPCSLVNRKKIAAASSIGVRLLRVVILEAHKSLLLLLLLLFFSLQQNCKWICVPYHTKNALPLCCDGKEEDDVGHVS
jgi:hypothetical protein